MIDPILSSAHPGGFHFTVAQFSSTGEDDVVTVCLYYAATTSKFFSAPISGRSLTTTELLNLRGVQWVQIQVTILGDTGQSFADVSNTLIDTLTEQERTTNLTPTVLYNWLVSVWASYKTYFVAALKRQKPYTLSLTCPMEPPDSLNITYPNILTANTPATIPPFQVYLPSSLSFSDLPLGDPATSYLSQSTASIVYPTPGTTLLSDTAVTLVCDPGKQTISDHTFTWYISGQSAKVGQQISASFTNSTTYDTKVPIVLLVTNTLTGVSAIAQTYVVVQP